MSERYVTVASYDVTYKADLIKTALEEAGIPAIVTDREIVAMDWLLANAVNGVKVQVLEADEPRALDVIHDLYRSGFDTHRVSDEELERQALEAAPEEGGDAPHEFAHVEPAGVHKATAIERDEYARRFMLASVFSLVFPPLAIYAVYLGLNAAFGTGPMTGMGWQRVGFGVAFGGLLIGVVTWLLIMMF
jgi:hypothetical protein